MLEIASKITLCLILAALLGLIIGYLLGKMKCVSHSNKNIVKTNNTSQTTPTDTHNSQIDNLTHIKGIGIKIEKSLNEIGIYNFYQIATWGAEEIAWADKTLGFPGRADREQWVEQAKILARGEKTEFSKRVDSGDITTSKKS